MAKQNKKKPRRKTKRLEDSLAHPVEKTKPVTDFDSLLEHMKVNPLLYAGAAAFIALSILAGVIYRTSTEAKNQELATAYAKAMDTQDPAMREAQLEKIKDRKGALHPEIVYMLGEAAYEAQDYDKAEKTFKEVMNSYPDSKFAADAVEGLGYIAEEKGEFKQAITYYKKARDMAGYFASRRQSYNIGRAYESLGDYKSAIKAYQEQETSFPGSQVAANAEAALSRLKESQPDLFAEASSSETGNGPASKTPAAAKPAPATPAKPAEESAKAQQPSKPAKPAEKPAATPPAKDPAGN